MAEVSVRVVESAADLAVLRTLFRAYASHLSANPSGAANICIAGYEEEVAGLPAPYRAVLLARVGGEPVGCVALKPLDVAGERRDGELACEMKRLYVTDGYRGLGLGRKLVVAAMDHARQTGHTALYLDTVPAAMPEANRLYDMLGFKRVERYNRNPVADVVFFRRAL